MKKGETTEHDLNLKKGEPTEPMSPLLETEANENEGDTLAMKELEEIEILNRMDHILEQKWKNGIRNEVLLLLDDKIDTTKMEIILQNPHIYGGLAFKCAPNEAGAKLELAEKYKWKYVDFICFGAMEPHTARNVAPSEIMEMIVPTQAIPVFLCVKRPNGRNSNPRFRIQINHNLVNQPSPKLGNKYLTEKLANWMPYAKKKFYTSENPDSPKFELISLCWEICNPQDTHQLNRMGDEQINVNDIDTEYAIELQQTLEEGMVNPDNIPQLVFHDIEKQMIEGFDEVGYGENTDLLGMQTEEETAILTEHINDKVHQINWLTDTQKMKLKRVLERNLPAFGCESSQCRMSNLTPMQVTLKAQHPRILAQGRQLGQQQTIFLREKLQQLEKMGIVKPSLHPLYGSAAFVVPKKGPKRWRMVIDMRELNTFTCKTQLRMPNLEAQISRVGNAKFFGSFDVLSGFDFLRVHEDSQKFLNIVTLEGNYCMLGSPMGFLNTPQVFQNRMLEEILKPTGCYSREHTGLLQWVDDTLIYSEDFDKYCETLDAFLKSTTKMAVRLNIRKCEFIAREIEWCGRYLTHGRWGFQKRYFNKILQMEKPQYVHQIAQVIYLCNWLGPTIPRLAELRENFAKFTNLNGKTLKMVKNQNKPIEWEENLEKAWKTLKEHVATTAERNLKNYQPKLPLLIFTDASKRFWSAIIMQVPFDNLNLDDIRSMQPDPLIFLSGKFTQTQINWHISQKELYPIIYSFKRLQWLVLGHLTKIYIFTDHKNLIPLIKPQLATRPTYLERLRRWGLQLQNADIVATHISESDNFFADLLSRWANPENVDSKVSIKRNLETKTLVKESTVGQKREIGQQNVLEINRLHDYEVRARQKQLTIEQLESFDKERISFLNPYYQGTWKRITKTEILKYQREEFGHKTDELMRIKDKIVIPEKLGFKLIVHNHIVTGHASKAQEMEILKEFKFIWEHNLTTELVIDLLHSYCIHCQRKPSIIKRPYQITKLGRHFGDVLHSDYLYVNRHGYILTLMDSLTRKILLKYTTSASATNVVDIILEWRANFNLNDKFLLVTDNGSHYANQILKSLTRELRFTQNFSVAYAPWSNGVVENINSPILRMIKSMTSELQLKDQEWPKLLPQIQYLLNNTRMQRRKNFTPNELFTGIAPKMNLIEEENQIVNDNGILLKPDDFNKYLDHVEKIREVIDERAEKVYKFVELMRRKQNRQINKRQKRGIIMNFHPGEWVLISKTNTKRATNKIKLTWSGPCQVVEIISDNVYKVRTLTNKFSVIHASRMWYYDSKEYVPETELKEIFTNDWGHLEVNKIKGLKIIEGYYQVLVSWLGFEAITDSWEPLEEIYNEIPMLIDAYLLEMPNNLLKKKVTKYVESLNKLDENRNKNGSGTGKSRNANAKINRIEIAENECCYDELGSDTENCSKPKSENVYWKKYFVTNRWRIEELEILRRCLMKYGIRNYRKIAQHIPAFNELDVMKKLKEIFGTYYKFVRGLRIDLNEIFSGNHNLILARNLITNKRQFEISTEKSQTIDIGYYRRLDTWEAVYNYILENRDKEAKTREIHKYCFRLKSYKINIEKYFRKYNQAIIGLQRFLETGDFLYNKCYRFLKNSEHKVFPRYEFQDYQIHFIISTFKLDVKYLHKLAKMNMKRAQLTQRNYPIEELSLDTNWDLYRYLVITNWKTNTIILFTEMLDTNYYKMDTYEIIEDELVLNKRIPEGSKVFVKPPNSSYVYVKCLENLEKDLNPEDNKITILKRKLRDVQQMNLWQRNGMTLFHFPKKELAKSVKWLIGQGYEIKQFIFCTKRNLNGSINIQLHYHFNSATEIFLLATKGHVLVDNNFPRYIGNLSTNYIEEKSRNNQIPVSLTRFIQEMTPKERITIIDGNIKDLAERTKVYGKNQIMKEKTTVFIGENYILLPNLNEIDQIYEKIGKLNE